MYESLERFLYGYNTWKWKCIFKINPSLLYNYSVIFIMKLKKITLVHISYLIINHGCIHLNKVQCINCFRNKYFPENTCSQCYRQLSTLFQTRHTYINFSAKMLPPKCYLTKEFISLTEIDMWATVYQHDCRIVEILV